MNYRSQLSCAIILIMLIGGGLHAQAQGGDGRAHHAAVVVQYAPGQVASRCVGFDQESMSGYDLLVQAGFNTVAEGAGLGAQICAIDAVGCDYPNEPCTCQCQGGECIYWSYSHLVDGVWRYSNLGASDYRVVDGAVDGWSWGPGTVQKGAEPPLVSFSAICGAQAAPPTSPPAPAATEEVPATRPAPTATPPATRRPATSLPAPTATRGIPTVPPPATRRPASSPPAPTATQGVAATRLATTATPPATRRPATSPPAPTATAASPTSPPATTGPATLGPAGIEVTVRPSPPVAPSAPAAIAPPAAQPRTGWLSYAAFGAILGLLGAAVVYTRRRQR